MICLKSVTGRVINERSVRRVDGNVWRNCYGYEKWNSVIRAQHTIAGGGQL